MRKIIFKSCVFVLQAVSLLICINCACAANFVKDTDFFSVYAVTTKVTQPVSKIRDLCDKKGLTNSISEMTGWKIFKNPYSNSVKFFDQPSGIWLNGNESDIELVQNVVTLAEEAVPVFVIYFIPTKDNYKPDQTLQELYLAKNQVIADIIGDRKAIVIIEPDALCLNANNPYSLEITQSLIKRTVEIYKTTAPNLKVYIDAGHSNWHSAYKVSVLLKKAGIDDADGFSTNVSNFQKTENELKYAGRLSKMLGDKRFVIDTSRNGNGPGQNRKNAPYWSDPVGVSTGLSPAIKVLNNGLDAYLWIKPPGEADGSAFPAGSWHPELIDIANK